MASEHTQTGKVGEQNHASSDHEEAAPEHGEFETAANPSQTLPLITEELTATHATDHPVAPAPSKTSHVTTPVLPPNPIRRDGGQGQATRTESTAHHNVAIAGSQATAGSEKNTGRDDTDDQTAKKEKSGGGVSATQLLAGAAAAATSSVIGGQLGVAGTVVGAGVASIITGLAVTLYTHSLDKGKEKFKAVGSKIAPAVKAKVPGTRTPGSAAVAASQTPVADRATGTFGNVSDEAAAGTDEVGAAAVGSEADTSESKSWWQKLRRKRVLYPVTIGVATFGIGLGAVVMAESFTDADISPGTSQISRSVSGNSGTGDESGTSQGGSSSSDSGSSGADSQPGRNSNPGSGNENSTSSEGQSSSASEGSSENSSTTDQTGTDQGTDTGNSESSSATSSSESSGSSSAGADTSGSSSSSGGDSSSGSQGSGGSSSSTGSSDGAGSGSGSSTGGSAAAAQG